MSQKLRYKQENKEGIAICEFNGVPVGAVVTIHGSLWHKIGQWKGQFFGYHCEYQEQEYVATEQDVQILPVVKSMEQ